MAKKKAVSAAKLAAQRRKAERDKAKKIKEAKANTKAKQVEAAKARKRAALDRAVAERLAQVKLRNLQKKKKKRAIHHSTWECGACKQTFTSKTKRDAHTRSCGFYPECRRIVPR